MSTYTNKMLVLEDGLVTKIQSGDNVQMGGEFQAGSLQVTGNADIDGNLTVQGEIISSGEVDVLISDHFIDLNSGQTTTTAKAGGYTVNIAANTTTAQETASAFVAGAAGNGPKFTSSQNPSNFAQGDIIQISGSDAGENDGLFVVDSIAGDQVTIYGIQGNAVSNSLPFAQNQFDAQTGQSATITKVDLAVLAFSDGNLVNDAGDAIAKGVLCFNFVSNATQAYFDGTSQGYTEVSDAAANSLQNAYDVGNTITTDGNAIAFTLSNGGFTVDEGVVNLGGTSALSSFNLDTSGAIAIDSSGGAVTLDGGAASSFVTSAGDLSLDAEAGSLNLVGQEADAAAVRIHASDAAGGIDIDAGSAGIALDASGAISLDASAGNVNLSAAAGTATVSASGAASLSSSAGAASVTAASGSQVKLSDSDASIQMTSGALTETGLVSADLQPSGALTLRGGGASTFGDDTAALAMDGSGATSLSGATTIDIDGSGAITLDSSAAGISLDSAAASNFTTSAGDLTLSSAGSAILSSSEAQADAIRIHASDAAGGIDIDGGSGGINVAAASGDIDIASTSGDVFFGTQSGEASVSSQSGDVTLSSAAGAALVQANGANKAATLESSNFSARVVGATLVQLDDGTAQLDLSSGALTETDLASIDLSPSGNTSLVADGTMEVKGGGQSDFGDDTGVVRWDGSGAMSLVGATTVDIDGSGAINVESSGAAINIGADDVAQAVNIATDGTRTLSLGSDTATVGIDSRGGQLHLNATGQILNADASSVEVDASAGISLDAGDESNFTQAANDAANKTLTIKSVNAGAGAGRISLLADSGDDAIAFGSSDGTALKIKPASTAHAALVSVNSKSSFASAMGGAMTAGEALAAGELVSFNSAGAVVKSDSDAGSAGDRLRAVAGVAVDAIAGAASGLCHAVHGMPTYVKFAAAPTNAGEMCYLSATAGSATQSVPAAGSVIEVGRLISTSADGNGNYLVAFAPRHVADLD